MKRTKAAFLLNVKELAQCPLHFWTFTFKSAIDVTAAREEWARLQVNLKRNIPKLQGLRVFEMHERHGLHVHVVTTRYVRVEAVRAVIGRMRSSLWGRIDVKKANAGIGPYLGKYLSKPRPECLKGWRMWAALDAKSYNHTRVADVILESLFSSVWQAATRCFGWKGNAKFAMRKSMVLTLSKLCVCWNCEPGLFPAPDGTMRPWALGDPDFSDWYQFGFAVALQRALVTVENAPF